jgi:hypothetical protein
MKLPLHLLLLNPATSLLPSLQTHRHRTSLNYKPASDENVWTVLANTEKWISDTLDKSNKSAREAKKMHYADDKTPDPIGRERSDNPYARKEVSYVCETGGEVVGVVGSIFKRVREARELGERHGRKNEGKTTMRSTNVVVIPNCGELSDFQTFDKLVQAINQARRRARDFVVRKEEGDEDNWVVSINCAHLHPEYGQQTPQETLQAMKAEEESGEIDLNLQEYKKRRDEARRSPYPSVIVEVQSTPPPEFSAAPSLELGKDGGEGVTSEDVQRLEVLFGMSAATNKEPKLDDDFYDALGEAFGNKQIAAQTPLSMAQNWVLANDPSFDETTSTFTTSNTHHVDAAYEYVFNTLAMISTENMVSMETPKKGQKSYIVLPNFLPTSATSFDRFAEQVSNIIHAIPSMAKRMAISTFHPEHVDAARNSPVPIFVVTWK